MLLTKRYHYPPYELLQQHELEEVSQLFSGADIAAHLSRVTPTIFTQAQTSPQFTTYHFDLQNPFELHKIKRALPPLSAILHREVVMVPSSEAHFALQIAGDKRAPVHFSQLIRQSSRDDGTLSALLGVTENNRVLTFDLSRMPHTLIAGTTGSGKSVLVNAIVGSVCFNYTPNDCRFVMIDPKQVELSRWDRLRDFLHCPVVTDMSRAADKLEELCELMDGRYRVMKRKRVTSSEGLFPRIVVVIDELADLMLTNRKSVEKSIVRIAQLGRAAGIHLLLATQRPSVNVVTGLIKANVPCRIALKTATAKDSEIVLDHRGAEKLLGSGDALVKFPDSVATHRFQAPYISSDDVARIASWWSHEPNWR